MIYKTFKLYILTKYFYLFVNLELQECNIKLFF